MRSGRGCHIEITPGHQIGYPRNDRYLANGTSEKKTCKHFSLQNFTIRVFLCSEVTFGTHFVFEGKKSGYTGTGDERESRLAFMHFVCKIRSFLGTRQGLSTRVTVLKP